MKALQVRRDQFFYPESDGRPMGETDEHRDIILHLIAVLKLRFRLVKNVYVSGNIMMYFVEGDANLSVCPDVFLVKGIPNRDRRVYKLWEEGRGPNVVIEVSSRGTKYEDLGTKLGLYRDTLKVREYYIYDPHREYLRTRMRAWKLRAGKYVARPVAGGRIHSRELGLDLVDAGGMLRLVDPETGSALPTLAEEVEARHRAEQEASAQAEARRKAEQEASVQAEARRKAEQEASVQAEARRKAELEASLLREELHRLRGQHGEKSRPK